MEMGVCKIKKTKSLHAIKRAMMYVPTQAPWTATENHFWVLKAGAHFYDTATATKGGVAFEETEGVEPSRTLGKGGQW